MNPQKQGPATGPVTRIEHASRSVMPRGIPHPGMNGSGKKLDLICFGNPTYDTIIANGVHYKCVGGSAVNTAAAFTKLGGKAGLIGRIGNDKPGQTVLHDLELQGINIERLRVDKKPTFTNTIETSPLDRKILTEGRYYGIHSLARADKEYLKGARAMYLPLRNELFLECAEFALNEGMMLFISAHRYFGEMAMGLRYDLRPYNILAIMGHESEMEFVSRLCKMNDATRMLITKDEQGSTYSCGTMKIDSQSFKVDTVDPTGAGDAFAAGVIWKMMMEQNRVGPGMMLKFANACGAIATTGYGAQQPITLARVHQLMNGFGETEEPRFH